VTLDIQPLTPARIDDLAVLFGQGGDPKWCWCDWQVGHDAVAATHRAKERTLTT
jgi:hypothetical protein